MQYASLAYGDARPWWLVSPSSIYQAWDWHCREYT